MNNFSKTEKLSLISCVVLCLFLSSLSIAPRASAEGEENEIYTPGTYTGASEGRQSTVSVTITVDRTRILSVQADASGETQGIGDVAASRLEGEFLAAQSADVDTVSGATITSAALKKAMQNALNFATIPIPDFILPIETTEICEEAFMGAGFTYVKISDKTLKIEARAFADCPNLTYICIPNKKTIIDSSAFDNVNGLTIIAKSNSVAETYANTHESISFIAIA